MCVAFFIICSIEGEAQGYHRSLLLLRLLCTVSFPLSLSPYCALVLLRSLTPHRSNTTVKHSWWWWILLEIFLWTTLDCASFCLLFKMAVRQGSEQQQSYSSRPQSSRLFFLLFLSLGRLLSGLPLCLSQVLPIQMSKCP